jgi:DNA adenine methylase
VSGNSTKLIAFNYFGGKFTWLEHIYSYFPNEFDHLIDLFAGSMSVSLNYKGSVTKTANEINADITNFFEVLRNHEAELTRLLLLTPCSKEEFQSCWEPSPDKIENARRFYVRVRQSYFGLGAQKRNKGWNMTKTKSCAKIGEAVTKWNNAIEKLHDVAEVIRSNFQITNFDYKECIEKIDSSGAFFYCDPPYPKETRASFNDYRFEFHESDHIELAKMLHKIKGKAMISSYNSDLYNDLYSDWTKVEFPSKNNNIRSGQVTEVIWMNYKKNSYGLFEHI